MIDLLLYKGNVTDTNIPADIRTRISIDTEITGPEDERLFSVMEFENIDPWYRLRNFYLGEVMYIQNLIAFCALTGAKLDLFDGVNPQTSIYDPATAAIANHRLNIFIEAGTDEAGNPIDVSEVTAVVKGYVYGGSFDGTPASEETIEGDGTKTSRMQLEATLPIDKVYTVELEDLEDLGFEIAETDYPVTGLIIGNTLYNNVHYRLRKITTT